MQRIKLDPDAVAQELRSLPGWTEGNGKLEKRFQFADFEAAFAWMTACALEAAALDHHPDWSNVYHRVEVRLWTHDRGGITDLDFALARAMDRHAARMNGRFTDDSTPQS